MPSRSPIEEKDPLVKEVMYKLVSTVTFVEVDGTSTLASLPRQETDLDDH
jgi:hypothetical protein